MRLLKPDSKQFKIIKAGLFLLACVPFLRLIIFAYLDQLGANPLEAITRNTGDWTLYMLCITLSITPLRRLSGWNWLLAMRRMLGLFTFFYASLHFLAFYWFDHFFDVQAMLIDVLKRPFIAMGFATFLLLLPLAITSTNSMMRKLGKRWKTLHQLIYLIILTGLVHFWWMRAGKQNFAQPLLITVIAVVLLGSRVVTWWQNKKKLKAALY
ncbi:MAG: sulfoxide reductase heme-binding subunit YedZ [Burkholderiales bacterium]|nr:sulfoxide reductase heme-binding subunit YedZ [Burkholderiales bacterium]